MLVLSVSTGCTSTDAVEPPTDYREVLKGMIPALPEVPSFPELSWSFHDGLYCISEGDADRLLDYGENRLPLFRWELASYEKQLALIVEQL